MALFAERVVRDELHEGVTDVDKRDTTLYVGNLPWRATEDDLVSLFGGFGRILDVRIIQDPATGRSRGYGFVEFDLSGQLTKAVSTLNGRDFLGRPLMVSLARPKPAREA